MSSSPEEVAVRKCVALLDVDVPDWRARIDTKMLNLYHPTLCVFGQVYGDYMTTKRRLIPNNSGWEYGVNPFGWNSATLKQVWISEIEKNRPDCA
jgi:hypothetical protein